MVQMNLFVTRKWRHRGQGRDGQLGRLGVTQTLLRVNG